MKRYSSWRNTAPTFTAKQLRDEYETQRYQHGIAASVVLTASKFRTTPAIVCDELGLDITRIGSYSQVPKG